MRSKLLIVVEDVLVWLTRLCLCVLCPSVYPRVPERTEILKSMSFSGRRSTLAGILLVLQLLVLSANAHMITLGASMKECFFEDLHVNDKVCLYHSQSYHRPRALIYWS